MLLFLECIKIGFLKEVLATTTVVVKSIVKYYFGYRNLCHFDQIYDSNVIDITGQNYYLMNFNQKYNPRRVGMEII